MSELEKELQDELLQTRILYLRGYLSALGSVASYTGVGIRCDIFAFDFSAGNIAEAVQHNAYKLYGVYPDEWGVKLEKCENWGSKIEDVLKFSVRQAAKTEDRSDDVSASVSKAVDYLIAVLKQDFASKSSDIYELTMIADRVYRYIGVDLIFEIADTKIILLQISGQ